MKYSKRMSVSSSDSDDIPLNLIQKNGLLNGVTSNDLFEELCRPSVEQCDFCDRTFNNKYKALIHNAKHIIIPLQKQKLHQCTECLYCFLSEKELQQHLISKHMDLMLNNVIVKCEKIPDFTAQVIQGESSPMHTVNRIKSRLIFEDDLEDDFEETQNGLLNDLTTDCKVNVEVFDRPWFWFSGRKNVNIGERWDVENNSVHYDELMKPGMYRCKRCNKTFPNRLESIKHEANHLIVRNIRTQYCSICEKLVAGKKHTLKKHMATAHPGKEKEKKCRKCGIKYQSYNKHNNNYHEIYKCYLCKREFMNRETREKHIKTHSEEAKLLNKDFASMTIEDYKDSNVKLSKICEVCYLFNKNQTNIHYDYMGDLNEIGMKYTCERCGNKRFSIKLIKMVRRKNQAKKRKNKPKQLSNSDRLRNIQQRLKNFNKLNKFCLVVSLLGVKPCYFWLRIPSVVRF